MIPIYTVCTGPKYTPWHVERLRDQFKESYNKQVKIHAYTTFDKDQFSADIEVIPIEHQVAKRQWYKVDLFKLAPEGETTFIFDLDWTFLDNITDILDQDVSTGELIAPYRWWTLGRMGYNINGGIYKFIGGDHQYLYDRFYQDPEHYMWKYIYEQKVAQPPVNGEQNFVEETLLLNNVIIKYFEPRDAIGRFPEDNSRLRYYHEAYMKEFGHEHYYLYQDLTSNVRMLQYIPSDLSQLYS